MIVALRDRLSAARQVVVEALHGMGGVGKTQLAVEYGYRFAGDYELCWWIDSEQPELIGEQLTGLAVALGLVEADAETPAALAVLTSYLGQHDRWLLIFDNAAGPAAVSGWLPSGPGHVLITSRHHMWGGVAEPVSVDVFVRAESVALLRRHVPPLTEADADRLADALGDLPLAVAQAAGLLAETGMSISQYLENFAQHAAELTAEGTSTAYPVSLAAAARLSSIRLEEEDPAAVQLLRLCAFLAPEPVPLDLFSAAPHGLLPKPLAATVQDQLAFRRSVGRIARYGLARLGDGPILHRLIQAILRDQLGPSDRDTSRTLVDRLLIAARPDDGTTPALWPRWAQLLPHILAADPASTSNDDLRYLAYCAVWHLHTRRDTRAALPLARHLHQQWDHRHGADDLYTLMAASNLAWVFRDIGEYERAQELDEDTLARRRRVLGEDHPDTLSSASNLAVDLLQVGEYERARELDEDTLARRRRVLGADDADTLSSASNLANSLLQVGEYERARELDEDTLARRRRVLGADHPDTLSSANKLAGAYQSAGDLGRAISLYEETLVDRERVLGPDHPDTLASRTNLAGAYLVTGNVVLVAGPEFPVVRGAVGRADLLRSLVDNGSRWPNVASRRRALEAIDAGNFDLVTRILRAQEPDLEIRIRDTYNKPTSPTTYDALAQIQLAGVVTMNWDPALEDAFALRSHVVVRGGSDEALAAAKSQEFAFTWFAGDPRQEQVAIGPREIRARLQSNETLSRFLTGVVQSSILLFAGVRATDIIDFFEALPQLRSAPGKLGSGARRHFGICAIDELWELNRSDLLNTYAVELIAYEHGGDDLTRVVHEMIGLAGRSQEVTADQADVPPVSGPLLSRIVLTNIGAFEELDLKLGPGWNLLLGNNGGGKSTILRAVALGLCGDHPSAIESGSRLLRVGSDLGLIELQVGPSVFRTELRQSSGTVIVRTSSLTPLQQGHWAVLGFPPLRGTSLVTPTGISATQVPEPRVDDLLPLLRGNVDDRLDDVKQWIINVEARSRQSGDARSRQLLEEFFQVLGALTPGMAIAYESVDPTSWEVWVRTDDGVVSIDQLSQGMNSIIAWVGTLLQRMYDIYPYSDRPLEQPAFVLVDELDAHLHPAWQRLLPDLIRERFPRVQFLATSHSPLMVGSLRPGELFVVARDTVPTTEGGERSVATVTAVDVDPKGLRADQILTSPAFGLLTSRSPAFDHQADRYDTLMRNTSRSPAEEEELLRLRSIIASSYRNGESAEERAIEAQQDAELDQSLSEAELSTGNIAALRRLADSLAPAEGEVEQ
jgi:tetratricopeptide (TPR) repeat protein